MAINLGDVIIGLQVNTEQLQVAALKLRDFAREVDRLSKDTSEGGQQSFRAFARQEGVLNKLITQVAALARKSQEFGADGENAANRLAKAYSLLFATLEKGEVAPHRLQRAIEYGRRVVESGKEELSLMQSQRRAASDLASEYSRIEQKAAAFKSKLSLGFERTGGESAVSSEYMQRYQAAIDRYKEAIATSSRDAWKPLRAGLNKELAGIHQDLQNEHQFLKDHWLREAELMKSGTSRLKTTYSPEALRAPAPIREEYQQKITGAYDYAAQQMKASTTSAQFAEAKAVLARQVAEATAQMREQVATLKNLSDQEKLATANSIALANAERQIAEANQRTRGTRAGGTSAEAGFILQNQGALERYRTAIMAAGNDVNMLKQAHSNLTTELSNNKIALDRQIASMKEADGQQKMMNTSAVALTNAQKTAMQTMTSISRSSASGTAEEAAALQKVADLYRSYTTNMVAATGNQREQSLLTAQYNRDLAAVTNSLNASTQAQKNLTKAKNDGLAVERMMFDAQAKVQQLNMVAERRFGAAATPYIEANKTAIIGYGKALDSVKGSTAALGLEKARFGKILADNNNLLLNAGRAGGGFIGTIRRMEEAAVLALGPLSGIGARLSIMATMMEQMPWKTFGFLAGITAISAGLAVMVKHAIQATIQFERWEAQMLVGTGTIITVGSTMKSVMELANKYGQSLEQVIPAYAKFAASARLAGISLKEQQSLFEATVKTAAALRLPEEGVQRMFLAFEQMAAKGTVTTEEIKRQLGDILPGAVELGAQAMGMSLARFMKALKDQEIQFSEFAPRMAKIMNEVFGEAARQGSESTQASIIRLGNAWLELGRKFDQTTKASTVFKEALASLTSLIGYVDANMRTIVTTVASAAAGISAAAVVWTVYRTAVFAWTSAAAAATAVQIQLSAAVSAGNLILAASPIGRVIILFTGLAAAIWAAYWAKTKFNQAWGEEADVTGEAINRIEMGVKVFEKTGKVLKETMQSAKAEVDVTFNEVKNRYDTAAMVVQKATDRIAAIGNEIKDRNTSLFDARKLQGEKKDMQELIAEYGPLVDRYKGQMDRLAAAKRKMDEIPTTEIKNDPLPKESKAIDNFREKIQALVRDAETAREKLDRMFQGSSAEDLRKLDALNRAEDVLGKMPKKFDQSELSTLLKGVAQDGETYAQTLGRIIFQTDEVKRQQRDYTSYLENFDDRVRTVMDTLQGYQDAADESSTATSQWANMLVAAERSLMAFEKQIRKVFDGSGYSKEYIDGVVKELIDDARRLQDIKFSNYWKRELDKVAVVLGDGEREIRRKFDEMAEAVNMNVLFGNLDPTEAAQQLGRLVNLMNREIEQLKLKQYFSDLMGNIHDWEQQTTDAFINMMRTGKSTFKELFESITWDITRMIVQRGITEPLFNMLFGGLANPNIGGVGSAGGFLMNLLPGTQRLAQQFGSSLGGGGAPGESTYSFSGNALGGSTLGGIFNNAWDSFGNWFINTFGMASGGFIPSNSTRLVGEEGPELFRPSVSGTIVPNDKLPRSGNTFHMTFNIPQNMSTASAQQLAAEIQARIAAADARFN